MYVLRSAQPMYIIISLTIRKLSSKRIFLVYNPKPNIHQDIYIAISFRLLQLILGPMFSGKSTELIRRLKRYQIARYPCLIVKYAKDIRYDLESIATHDQQTLKAISADKLKNLKVNLSDYDVIGIDEGQFFPDIVEFSEEMANKGKTVVIAALDGTFQRKAFASILELIPLSEHVVKLNAVCMTCFGDGSFTKRISADKEVHML